MHQCVTTGNFAAYWRENMDALGLPVPSHMFSTGSAILGSLTALYGAADKYGSKAPLSAILRASTLARLHVTGAVTAAYYIGASTGSAAVASGRVLGCGTSLADALWWGRQIGLYRVVPNWLNGEYARMSIFTDSTSTDVSP